MARSLKALGVDFPYMIAPMVGISHVAFRELVRSYTPTALRPLRFTEMLSTRRIPNERVELVESLYCAPEERDFVPQLLGNDEKFIAPSIQRLLSSRPWGFDINMGCPTKKTIEHNWGVRLMGDMEYAADVVRITKKHSPLPVSVKIRAAFGEKIDLEYLYRFTEKLENAGADWMTVHCRPSGQRHRGHAYWEILEALQAKRTIPLVANGNIQTADDAISLVRQSGVGGAMIARAAVARPWICWQIGYKLGLTDEVPPLTKEEEGKEFFRAGERFFDFLLHYFSDSKKTLYKAKLYTALGGLWIPFGHDLWKQVNRAKSVQEAKENFLAWGTLYPQKMLERATL